MYDDPKFMACKRRCSLPRVPRCLRPGPQDGVKLGAASAVRALKEATDDDEWLMEELDKCS